MRRRLTLCLCLPLMAALAACDMPANDAAPTPPGATAEALLVQQGDVRQAIGNRDVGVSNDGTNVTVMFPAAALFGSAPAALTPAAKTDLTRLAAHLRSRMPGSTVIVIGHTDSTGSASDNQALSERRAQGVARTLVAGGVPVLQIKALGQGSARPAASNSMPEGRALNNRVEIIIRPGA